MPTTTNDDQATDKARVRRLVELLNEYGAAKFGDEWWPGAAGAHLDRAAAAELEELLEERLALLRARRGEDASGKRLSA